ncbi:peptide ABC transporter substrate-binding protein [Paenibacillus sp. 102]|uniref:peptide ABC transporter substrate-binding protein n=1 Tax=Paenibacillus sp. 102 TaxID=3120823 RepID=UPI0031BB6E4F
MQKGLLISSSVLLAGSLFLGACSKSNTASETPKTKKKEQILNIAETADISTLDTGRANDTTSFNAITNVMEGLYRMDKENNTIPAVAKSVDVSEDKKTYTFHLRDAKWSNGDSVTASDFVYAWKRVVDPEFGASYAFIMYDIKNAKKINSKELAVDQLGVTAKDDKTLIVELENPVPYFLELTSFATYFPLNQKFVEEKGKDYALKTENMLYNGPFTIAEWKVEQGYTLKKNPNYWDKQHVKLNQINVNIVKDSSTAVNLYEAGQLDRVLLTAELVDKYKDSKEFKTEADNRLNFIRFNQKDKVMANEKVRKAIDMAYNKEGITNTILNNGSVPAYFVVPKKFVKGPDGKDFREANGDFDKYNPKKASQLWEEAKKELGMKEVTIEFLNYDDDASKKISELIKGELEKNLSGITVEIKQIPNKQKLELEDKLQYQFSLGGWGPDYPDPMTFIDIFATGNDFIQMDYNNPEYKEIVQKGKDGSFGVKERWKALQKAEKLLMEDRVISPVYQKGRAYVQKTYVKNVHKLTFGADYDYKEAYIEK